MSFFNLLCGLILEGFRTTVEAQLTAGECADRSIHTAGTCIAPRAQHVQHAVDAQARWCYCISAGSAVMQGLLLQLMRCRRGAAWLHCWQLQQAQTMQNIHNQKRHITAAAANGRQLFSCRQIGNSKLKRLVSGSWAAEYVADYHEPLACSQPVAA
eukprot:GHRQ01019127.1.p1 GENE.GHRQ01019127.1~~GHRQ01019127.1.p1  ORF type:complete len:156 (+),score=31.35 GHRQ01019127.1:833-1300(+)